VTDVPEEDPRTALASQRTNLARQLVKRAWILKRKDIQFVWNAEDHVKIAGRQHFSFARCHPALTRLRLAFRAMPVATGVIGDGLSVAALKTSIKMSAQRRSAAVLDSAKRLQLLVSKLD
jgi:hypothetical protein